MEGNELEQQVNQERYADFQGSRLEERLVGMEGSMEAGTYLRNKYPEQRGDAGSVVKGKHEATKELEARRPELSGFVYCFPFF